MRAPAAVLILCLAPIAAQAKTTTRLPPVQEFKDVDGIRVSQAGTTAKDVTRAVRKPSHTRKWRGRVPVPRPRPGVVAPLSGIVAPLAAKVRQLVAACPGAKMISGIRHTYIAGTGGRLSLHASGRAADVTGSPSCLYPHLRDWPGGVSVDYARVRHVHISYAPGGPEWGIRFNHYRGGHRKRHKHRRRV